MNDLTFNEKGRSCCPSADPLAACCQPAGESRSSCCTPGERSWNKGKILVSAIIIVAAIGVGAHSFVKATSAQSNAQSTGKSFSAGLTAPTVTASESNPQVEPRTNPQGVPLNLFIDSLQDLDTLAADKEVVFLVLAGEKQATSQAVPPQLGAVANNLSNTGQKVAVFTLRTGKPDYLQLAVHFSIGTFPSVVVLGRQGAASAVTGDIEEARLYNAFVLASKPVACCPAQGNASCCPK